MQIGSFCEIKFIDGVCFIRKGNNKNFKKATEKDMEMVNKKVFRKECRVNK